MQIHVFFQPCNVNSAHLNLQTNPPQLLLIQSFRLFGLTASDGGMVIRMSGGYIPPVVSKGRVIPGRGHYEERTGSRKSHVTQTHHWSASAALWLAPPFASLFPYPGLMIPFSRAKPVYKYPWEMNLSSTKNYWYNSHTVAINSTIYNSSAL